MKHLFFPNLPFFHISRVPDVETLTRTSFIVITSCVVFECVCVCVWCCVSCCLLFFRFLPVLTFLLFFMLFLVLPPPPPPPFPSQIDMLIKWWTTDKIAHVEPKNKPHKKNNLESTFKRNNPSPCYFCTTDITTAWQQVALGCPQPNGVATGWNTTGTATAGTTSRGRRRTGSVCRTDKGAKAD